MTQKKLKLSHVYPTAMRLNIATVEEASLQEAKRICLKYHKGGAY
jgi:hypothetical protein